MITSFSQKALLSSFYQNYLNPPNCEAEIVQDPSGSLFDTFSRLDRNLYEGTIKAGYLHTALEPVRAVARMVFMVAVGVIVAPLGMAWHTANAVVRLNGTHAFCAYADFCASFQTLFVCVMTAALAYCVLNPRKVLEVKHPNAHRIWVEAFRIFVLALAIGMPMWRLGGLSNQKFIPEVIGHSENRVAMFIALRLRHDLGLVGRDGGPLPFNETDNFSLSFARNNWIDTRGNASGVPSKLILPIIEAEYELSGLVGSANRMIPENQQVQYQHSFEGVDTHFTSVAATMDHRAPLDILITAIRRAQNKITIARQIFQDACEVSANGGFGEMLATTMASQSSWHYPHVNAYSDAEEHRRRFEIAAEID